ncbi:MAG: phosphate signaling complex protein PhoU [Gammaproteobacteria bacterium]|nr:phosphate signaling complex protein PhoU [Gammaproteobacteria bacterium]
MSIHFHREVDRLIEDLISFGEGIEDQLQQSVDALQDRDASSAKRVIRNDADLDQIEVEMEEECLKLLALHQPLAGDLRQIISVLKINNDLERVGDHAANIAERVIDLEKLPAIEMPEEILKMSKQARMMLRLSLLAFVESDRMLTNGVFEMDDEVDELNKTIFRSQIKAIEKAPAEAEQRILLLSICKQLERVGDLASNIAEDVVYLMSGDIIRHGGYESGE